MKKLIKDPEFNHVRIAFEHRLWDLFKISTEGTQSVYYRKCIDTLNKNKWSKNLEEEFLEFTSDMLSDLGIADRS